MTEEELVDRIAEEIWQAEAMRINHGRKRLVDWSDNLTTEVDKYKFTARHLLSIFKMEA